MELFESTLLLRSCQFEQRFEAKDQMVCGAGLGERVLNTYVSYFIRDGFVEDSLVKFGNLRNIGEISKMGREVGRLRENQECFRWGDFSGQVSQIQEMCNPSFKSIIFLQYESFRLLIILNFFSILGIKLEEKQDLCE